jgi:hypothetical protein
MGGLNVRTKKLLLIKVASGLCHHNLQHILSFGKVLRIYHTKFVYYVQMAESKASGMVKVDRIGQPACRKASETERMWVEQNKFCLRYSPSLGKLKDTKCLLQLECLLYWLLQDNSFNHFLMIHNKNEYTTIHNSNNHRSIETICIHQHAF